MVEEVGTEVRWHLPSPEQPWGIHSVPGAPRRGQQRGHGLVLLRGGWRPRPREETGVSQCREDRQGRLACHPAYPTPCWDDAETPTRIRPPREKEGETPEPMGWINTHKSRNSKRWGLHSVPLPIPHWLDSCRSIVSLDKAYK